MVDYSKWKDIEISDDEDDTHPNIDTPSLFRWRHKARVERMEEKKQEEDKHTKKREENKKKLKATREKLSKLEKKSEDSSEWKCLKKALEELEEEHKMIIKEEEELQKKEKLTPWNVDTIGQDGFTKTVINIKPPRQDDDAGLSEEEREQKMKKFVKDNEKLLKKYGMFQKYDDSKVFLQENLHLVCENTANYLVIWCVNLQMEEKTELMEHVAHQCICMQYILELSKQLDVDPRACVAAFFSRIQVADPEYKNAFDDELKSLKLRIRKRADEKLAEAMKEVEEEERQARLGPGGLDPVEVFETLPEELQKCFEAKDIPMLQETIAKMPEDEARYHMKRCVDSGLWVPEAKTTEETPNQIDEPNVETDPK